LLVGNITVDGAVTPLVGGSIVLPDVPAGGKAIVVYQCRVQ
jgi:hypothetical protein